MDTNYRGIGSALGLFMTMLLGAMTIFGADVANGQIVSASARYDKGVLVVRGVTAKPRQFVRLNRFRIKLSNRVGRFVFHQTRFPQDCSVRLQSTGHQLTVPIRNCPLYGSVGVPLSARKVVVG
jgi:hypothetical protein